MVLILITIVLAALFAPIERKVIDTRITTGILADLDHAELTEARMLSWAGVAILLIAFGFITLKQAACGVIPCMAAFATTHRIIINGLRERPMWYLGIGSWYDRKLIKAVLWLSKYHEDLSRITSAQHYNRIGAIPYYRKSVRNAGFFAYSFEITIVALSLFD